MFTYNIKYFYITLVILLCIGCTENALIEIEHDSALAVNAQLLQGDSLMYISVSQTFGLGDTLFYDDLDLDNIELSLMTPDQGVINAVSNRQSNSDDGLRLPIWEFDYADYIAGEEYLLSVENDGLGPVTATVIIPEKPTIVDVVFTPSNSDDIVVRDRFDLTLSDPASEDNYYYIRAFETIEEVGFEYESDYRFYSLPSNPIDEAFLEQVVTTFNDRDFNGTEHTITLYGERIQRNQQSVKFQLFQITKDHHDFIQNYDKFNTDSPIAEPVIFNSNIVGGHGIFAVSSKPDVFVF